MSQGGSTGLNVAPPPCMRSGGRFLWAVAATVVTAVLLLFQPSWFRSLGLDWLLELWQHSAPQPSWGYGDKVVHACLFGVLQWLWLGNGLRLERGRAAWLGVGVAVFLYSAGLESLQRLLPERSFELGDLTANALGIVVSSWLFARSVRGAPELR